MNRSWNEAERTVGCIISREGRAFVVSLGRRSAAQGLSSLWPGPGTDPDEALESTVTETSTDAVDLHYYFFYRL